MSAVLPRVQAIIEQNPDLAYSRLLCPRRLDDNTGYHAFVVPVFETGRLAGLGKDPSGAPHATSSAWDRLCRQGPSRPIIPYLLPLVFPHRLARRFRIPRHAC